MNYILQPQDSEIVFSRKGKKGKLSTQKLVNPIVKKQLKTFQD